MYHVFLQLPSPNLSYELQFAPADWTDKYFIPFINGLKAIPIDDGIDGYLL